MFIYSGYFSLIIILFCIIKKKQNLLDSERSNECNDFNMTCASVFCKYFLSSSLIRSIKLLQFQLSKIKVFFKTIKSEIFT